MNNNERTQFIDNLFSGNHRTNMMAKHDYTEALDLTVDDLNFQAYRPEDYCKHCQLISQE
jgi:hypothetical protein